MTQYRGNPDAVRALVRSDEVHRDLYISQELFELEQENLFANTWNYVGHDSQIPNPGDYITTDIAGEPLIIARHTDGSVRGMMNRCAHKGVAVAPYRQGNTGKFFRCPYHGWTYRTDGSLLSVPLKSGMEDTGFDASESAKGLSLVRHLRVYRGFIFVKLNDVGEDFEEYFGDSLSSIDNMADRSPVGELEIAGGCLRFINECNWKMYVENLNDTTHPMVTHEASAGAAKTLWAGHPEDEPKPMAVQQLVPFVSGYKFFEDAGLRVFGHGHSVDGVNFSIHSDYSGVPQYTEAMDKAYGPERAKEILTLARHNTVYYPNLTIKGAIQSIRVVKPISADRCVLESWTFRLKGAPDELLQRTCMYTRLINAPFSVVGADDVANYREAQKGLHAGGNPWVSLHRNYVPSEEKTRDQTVIGTSDLSMRGQFRAWANYMTMTM